MKPVTKRALVRIAAGLILAYVLLWLMSVLETVTTVLMISLILAYMVNPLVNKLQFWGLSRSLASILIVLSVIMFFVLFLIFFVPAIFREIASFGKYAPSYLKTLEKLLEEVIRYFGITIPQTPDEIKQLVIEQWQQVLPKIANPAARVASTIFSSTMGILSFVFYALLIPILTYYLMVSFENIRAGAKDLIPPYSRPAVLSRLNEIDTALSAFVRGQVTVSLILAVLYSIGFVLIGIDLAIVLGVTSGLLFIIPYFGTLIGIIGGSLMALAKFGDLTHVLYVLGWISFVQLLEGNLITPKVVGSAIGLNPVVYILALIVAGNLFGLVGLLVAIPVTAILKVVLVAAVQAYRESQLYSDHVTE